MTISQKCNCCIHEDICAKKPAYEGACRRINTEVGTSNQNLVTVNISCKYFYAKSVMRGDQNAR